MQRVLSFPPSRGFGDPSEFISKRMCFAFMFTLGFLSFLGGFLLGRFVFDKELEKSRTRLRETQSQKEQVFGVYKNYSQFSSSSMIEALSESSIQKYLGLLTSDSNEDSSSENFRKAKILQNHLTSNGFDLVSPMMETQMQLSYPSAKHPNEALIINLINDEVELKINDTREKYSGPKDEKINTTVVESTIVYVNFGRNEDYQYLDIVDIRYSGKIFLIRAGKIPTFETVSNAVEHGAAGILIYLDPEQTEIELPLVRPVDLAKLHIHYGNHIDKWGGTIPVLEISSFDATALFRKMKSIENILSTNWSGKLKTSYKIGTAFINEMCVMRMKVSTVNTDQTFYDVLGAMRGSQEPDRYVMLTNENIVTNEENSASIIMEIVRVLGNLKQKGWKPHRSIVVAFWGTEGPNMHLSSYPESVLMQIIRKTVAYLKIDSVDFLSEGSQTTAKVTPILEKVYYQSAQAVSLHNTTADIMPTLDSNNLFINRGVPFLILEHYSTKTLKDVASFWGMTIWQLVESYKLPFSLESYANFFAQSKNVIQKRFKTIPQDSSLYLESLFQKLQQLISAIRSFEAKWSQADKSKSIEMRIMTDQILDFTRFLICGSDSSVSTNHNSSGYLIFSRSITGHNEEAGFGELQDLLQDIISDKNTENIHKQVVTHLASLIETINLCRDALNDGLDILIKNESQLSNNY